MSNKSKHVKVVIRTRPTAAFAQDIISFGADKKSFHIHIPKNEEDGYINNQQENWDFKFDHILHNSSQEVVYEECGQPIVKGLLDGYNGTILAYGQTGAGKTFTMTGATENFKHRGLIPRAISNIFKEISDRPQLAYIVKISYIEIYKEQMIDLLSTVGDKSDSSLVIAEEKNGAIYVKGLTMQLVSSEEEALNLLFEGEMNRSISEHQLNKSSSRSHCVFTIHVESRSRVESSEKVMISKLNLVDLAGSERLSKTETSGISLKEAMYINRSLTFLEQVIIALADKKRDHIPYRQSKMTHVLRDSLGGNCNTLMIANIWGESIHVEETISTLRFATRMMCVTNSAEINIQYDPLALIKKYEREIRDLKQELSMHDTLANRSHVQYEPFSDAHRYELQKQIKSFLENDNEEIEIINLRQIKEIFNQFKNIYKSLEAEKDESIRTRASIAPLKTTTFEHQGEQPIKPVAETERDDGVGDTDGGGFGIGISPTGTKASGGLATGNKSFKKSSQKPTKTLTQVLAAQENSKPAIITDPDETAVSELVIEPESIKHSEINVDNNAFVPQLPQFTNNRERRGIGPPLSRADEFENFKLERGQSMYRNLTENKATLKDKKRAAKELAENLNTIKTEMDSIKEKIDERKLERASLETKGIHSDKGIVDEEEFGMLNHIKVLREKYRDNHLLLKAVRTEIDFCTNLVDQCRSKFMTEFEQWYETIYGGQINIDNSTSNGQIEDVLDIGEKFDRLQMERMSQEDPDSLPYYNARKNTERRTLKVVKKANARK